MPETAKQVIKSRTTSHSDVSDTPAARAHQSELATRQFGDLLVRRLREAKGEIRLRNYQEEWLPSDAGLVLELSVEAEVVEA